MEMESKGKKFTISCIEPDDLRQEEITAKLIGLDRRCFGEINIEDAGDMDYWLMLRPACFTFVAFVDDQAIGYLDLLSISSQGADLLAQGKLRDGQMKGYVVERGSPEVMNNVYVIATAVDHDFRRQGVSRGLWNFAKEYLFKNGYDIQRILATVWTEEGMMFFGKFSCRQVGQDCFCHPVVELEF